MGLNLIWEFTCCWLVAIQWEFTFIGRVLHDSQLRSTWLLIARIFPTCACIWRITQWIKTTLISYLTLTPTRWTWVTSEVYRVYLSWFNQRYKLFEEGHETDALWTEIKSMIVKTFISAQPILAHHIKSCQPDNFANNMCFEILGFDVMLDHKLKPYVLEVNHTPSFTTDTPLDCQIKKSLIRDTLILMNINTKVKNQLNKQKLDSQ